MMADIPLRSIKFPGLADTYTVPQIDSTLAVTGKAADAKATGDALTEKANVDGEYESMTVGNAEQLVSTVFGEDSEPYLYRTAGGSAEIGDREYDKIIGATVGWNQLVKNGNFADYTLDWLTEGTKSKSDDGFTMVWTPAYTQNGIKTSYNVGYNIGHKYIVKTIVKNNASNRRYIYAGQPYGMSVRKYIAGNSKNTICGVLNIERNSGQGYDLLAVGGYDLNVEYNLTFSSVMLFDLTQMFGSTIANYIYSIETATPGAGVAWFRKLFPADYYAYNAGELISVQTSAHKMVGFNAYNPTAGKAKIVGGMVYQVTGAFTALSLDGVTIEPDEDGYFTPEKSGELTVTGGNATTTCVHLVWNGERDGEWEEYKEHTYPLDSGLTLRGIPKLDANNKLYYDGDIYESDGTVTRKFGIRAYESGDATDGVDMVTDGTNTVYRLAALTTEQAAPYQNPQVVDNFGTEEYVTTSIVPVGHETKYAPNLRAKLETAPDSPSGDGDYIMRQTGGMNAYAPLVIPKELPANPETDGTYVLKATVTNGETVLSWEVEA